MQVGLESQMSRLHSSSRLCVHFSPLAHCISCNRTRSLIVDNIKQFSLSAVMSCIKLSNRYSVCPQFSHVTMTYLTRAGLAHTQVTTLLILLEAKSADHPALNEGTGWQHWLLLYIGWLLGCKYTLAFKTIALRS